LYPFNPGATLVFPGAHPNSPAPQLQEKAKKSRFTGMMDFVTLGILVDP
jgi:hypothetical protein